VEKMLIFRVKSELILKILKTIPQLSRIRLQTSHSFIPDTTKTPNVNLRFEPVVVTAK